jgi:hypothetical protein
MTLLLEQLPITEVAELSFGEASKQITEEGYTYHSSIHDEGGEDPKIFHTSEHPKSMERRADQMAEIFGLTNEQKDIIEMAIAWHDTVIEYDSPDSENLLGMIRRHRGAREGDISHGINGNEGQSAKLLKDKMISINEFSRQEIFTQEQINTAGWCVEATYPDVKMGTDFQGLEFKTYPQYQEIVTNNSDMGNLVDEFEDLGIKKGALFSQPHLEQSLEQGEIVPKEVLIVALSDLGASGLEDSQVFFKEGDDEMRELYSNLQKPEIQTRLYTGDEEQDIQDREKVAGALLKWVENQPSFAIWQALRFEKIVGLMKQNNQITDEQEQALRKQFSHFEDNIRGSYQRAQSLRQEFENIKVQEGEKQAFVNLAKNLHFEV